ncbi:MAG: metallopeptidase TldD-related protein, partial [Thermoanaerobaculia bacterium]
GRALTPGRMDLLLDSHVAAHVVGRLAPLFFGDQHDALLQARTREGRDPFAAPVLSLIDDASAPGGPIRTVRDAEGTPKRRTVLVEAGRLAGRLTDVETASRMDGPLSGNAVRLTWSDPPRIGVTNFYIDPSPGVSPLDLLASVSKGFYAAVLLERPEVDLAADKFRLLVAGYTVEKGRVAERISECGISGRLSELLRGVAALGDDLKFVAGAGGGVGSPTLYVPRWKIS